MDHQGTSFFFSRTGRSFYPTSCSASCYRIHVASIGNAWQASSSIAFSCIRPGYWKKAEEMITYITQIGTMQWCCCSGVTSIDFSIGFSIAFVIWYVHSTKNQLSCTCRLIHRPQWSLMNLFITAFTDFFFPFRSPKYVRFRLCCRPKLGSRGATLRSQENKYNLLTSVQRSHFQYLSAQ